ncbi:hypothetical protein Pelo_14427 [Pelomyxa schiedti]|nr:hypothetical protein Pelo_14427 [Pelomyxa schiedti]
MMMNPDAMPFVPRTRVTGYTQCCLCSRLKPRQAFVGPFQPCNHSFCRECLHKHIGQQLNQRIGGLYQNKDFVVCPVRGCNTTLQTSEFRPLVVTSTSIPAVARRTQPTISQPQVPEAQWPAFTSPGVAQPYKQSLPNYDPLFHAKTYVDCATITDNMNPQQQQYQQYTPTHPKSPRIQSPSSPSPKQMNTKPHISPTPQQTPTPRQELQQWEVLASPSCVDEQQYISNLPEDFWSSSNFMLSSAIIGCLDDCVGLADVSSSDIPPWQGVGKSGAVIKAHLS